MSAVLALLQIATVLFAAGAPVPVAAAPAVRDVARAKVAEGAQLYQQGRYADAVVRYQAAYALFPSPKIHYNLGLAYRGLGKSAQAFAAFDRFVREARDAAPAHLAEAQSALGQLGKQVAFLQVASDAPDAEAFLDGVPLGPTPVAPTPVDPGRHQLIVRSPSLGTWSKPFVAAAGAPLTLNVPFRAPGPPSALTPAGLSPGQRGGATAVAGAAFVPSPSLAMAAAAPPGSTPLASGASQAEALIREATQLRRAGKDALAYPLLQKAYEAETTPRTAAQLGLVEMQLGYWLPAEQHLIEALSFPQDPWIASNRKSLEQSLVMARAAIGEIVVTGKPEGASVLINGKPAGNLPLPAAIRVGSGPVKVEIRASGHTPEQRSLTLHGGRRQEISVSLQTASATDPPAPAGPSPAGSASTLAPVQRQPPPVDDLTAPRAGSPLTRPLAWTAAGLAAGAIAFAAYETTLWQNKSQQFSRHTAPPRAPGGATTCGIRERDRGAPGCSVIYGDMEQAKKLALTGFIAGALLAAGAAALFVIPADARPAGDVACAPSPDLTGAFCRLTF